jgi:tripartite-type tricarboxylate transporter receptor subunit TctC
LHPRMWIFAAAVMAAISFSGATDPARSTEFPERPIQIVVPYAPGGPSDVGARLMADALSRHIGQTVYVENKPGSAGLAATESYLHGTQDGYTLLTGAIGPFAIIPAFKAVPYDPIKDFAPIGLVWRSSQVLVVNPKLKLNSLAEFVAYAKANPGKITVGSVGVGSITHMSLELFKQEAKVDLLHVPYKGTGAEMPNLLGGQLDASFADVTLIAPYVKSGALRGLAITAPQRSPLLPDVPTTAEAGLPQVDTQNWFGIVAGAKTPPERLAKLRAAVRATLADPAYTSALKTRSMDPATWDADSFSQLIAAQIVKWKPVVQAAHIKF